MRPSPAVSALAHRRVAAASGAAGAGGHEEITLRMNDLPEEIVFDLAFPGHAPVATRRLLLK
ncbi:hypothetical protein V5F59_13505 [Xanthobacter autotrophicus DSM 431]|uniref:hypothetical protein n=1 Tax=Xanthobacter nonsaccharivorans TaxID=3119912 RepID=UPI00372BC3EC